jgi:hypothetical protein
MTCSKGNSKQELFWCGGAHLDSVDKFKYLGIIVHRNGKFKEAIKDRCLKSRRAMYALKKALSSTGNISPKLALSLFDKQISPILLYGCPVWGSPTPNNYVYLDNVPEDISPKEALRQVDASIHAHMCKRVGRRKENSNRPVLINTINISDKFKLSQSKALKTHN